MKINVVIELIPEWERHSRGLDIAEIIRECVERGLEMRIDDMDSRGHVVSCEIVKEEHA